MAEHAMARARLLRLATELAQELAVAERIAEVALADAHRLEEQASPGQPEIVRGNLAVLAVGLHRWYCAVESMVERVERAFGTVPTSAEWHADLLAGAVLEIPGVRPPILPAECLDGLRETLRFRHFFRHAYAVELDRAKLLAVAANLTAIRTRVGASLRAFGTFLTDAASAIS